MRQAASRAACTAGSSKPTRIPIIAITTNSSTNVKPCRVREDGSDALIFFNLVASEWHEHNKESQDYGKRKIDDGLASGCISTKPSSDRREYEAQWPSRLLSRIEFRDRLRRPGPIARIDDPLETQSSIPAHRTARTACV